MPKEREADCLFVGNRQTDKAALSLIFTAGTSAQMQAAELWLLHRHWIPLCLALYKLQL